MTTLHLTGVSADARHALHNAHWARASGRRRADGTAPAVRALSNALTGGEDTPDVDVSGMTRRDLSSFVRLIESVIELTPNAGPLVRFVSDVVAADVAANPNALPLRTV